MAKRRILNPDENVLQTVIRVHDDTLMCGEKIRSFGSLLERQGDEEEGYTELRGMGRMLIEIADEIEEAGERLDALTVQAE